MPRYRALPTVVEAHQFTGTVSFWPDPFRRAVVRHIPGGITEVMTADGARPVRFNDWVVYGPDGFTVVHEAAFEARFEELAPVMAADEVRAVAGARRR
jgi:hypothetical protein